MAIDDHSELAFELILQPSALNSKLLSRQKNVNETEYRSSIPDSVVMAVLSDFLQQLQSCPNLSAKSEPGFVHENSLRKRSYIQSMVLQIHAFYNWDLELVQKHLPLNLQSQLLETLLCSCGKAQNVFLTNKECISSGEALNLKDLERSTVFAVQLFLRWVLRTLPTLNDPVPSGNKVQLYGIGFGAGGGTGGIPQDAIGQLNALRFTAVKTMESLVPVMTSLVPSPNSFRVNPSTLETECQNDVGWINLEESATLAQTLFDLVAYNFFIESYSVCRQYLQTLSKIKPHVLKKYIDMEVTEGYRCALSVDTTEKSDIERKTDDRRINLELSAWANCNRDLGRKLSESNVTMRIEKSYPPNFEYFVLVPKQAGSTKGQSTATDFRRRFFTSLASPEETSSIINYDSERPVLVEKSSQKASTKHPKVRKRDILAGLLRERNPEKVPKLLQEIAKLTNVPIRRSISRWQVDEAQNGLLLALTNLSGPGARGGPDSDLVFILLAKLRQLIDLKCYNDSPAFFNSILRYAGEKMRMDKQKMSNIEIKINVQVLYMKMLQFGDTKLTREEKLLPVNFVQQCRDCFAHLLATTTPGTTHDSLIMEQMIATLLNLGEFEFLLARGSDKRWRQLELACHLASLVLHFRNKCVLPPPEFKKVFKALEDILINVAQSGIGVKKSRDMPPNAGSNYDFDKRYIVSFINKLQHPDVTDLIKAFLVSCFNSSVTDSTQSIQCDLLALPVSPKNTNLNTELLLSLLSDMSESTTDGFRVRAEIHFARGNYLLAMKNYLESLIISTNYFNKPWNNNNQVPSSDWDERIFQKMIKCTSELCHHHQAAVLCQFAGGSGGDCDYATAFRSLEERNSNDAMDELYDYLWDVTLLEYIVSMHAKRGEFSRKRRALDIITQVEININNNEEILREARATRRAAFMRYMCSVFL